MERTVASWSGVVLSEPASFLVKSGIFLVTCGAILYVLLAAAYPCSSRYAS